MKKLMLPTMLLYFLMIALAASVNESTAAEATDGTSKNLLKPTNDLDSWQLELNEGGKGDMVVDGDAIVFHVAEVDGTNWHVQAYQLEVDLKEGQQYRIRFKMKAPDSSDVLLLGLINQEDWHEVGLNQEMGPSQDFTDYDFTFTATDVVDKNNRIGFVLGASTGTVSIKEVTLTAE